MCLSQRSNGKTVSIVILGSISALVPLLALPSVHCQLNIENKSHLKHHFLITGLLSICHHSNTNFGFHETASVPP